MTLSKPVSPGGLCGMNSLALALLFPRLPYSSPEAVTPSDLDLPVLFMHLITLYRHSRLCQKKVSWYRKVHVKATLLTCSFSCTGSGPIFSVSLGPFVERVTPSVYCLNYINENCFSAVLKALKMLHFSMKNVGNVLRLS